MLYEIWKVNKNVTYSGQPSYKELLWRDKSIILRKIIGTFYGFDIDTV